MWASTDTEGKYTLYEFEAGTYQLVPSRPGLSFWPAKRTVAGPPDATGQDFTILPHAVSTTLSPGLASGFSSYDLQGLPTILSFSDNAVTETTVVTLTPTVVVAGDGLAFAKHAFELIASRHDHVLSPFTFDAPVTTTIYYSDKDVLTVSDEAQLALYKWTGGEWQDASRTCDPVTSYTRDPVGNVLIISICQTGTFALLGPTNRSFLPIVQH